MYICPSIPVWVVFKCILGAGTHNVGRQQNAVSLAGRWEVVINTHDLCHARHAIESLGYTFDRWILVRSEQHPSWVGFQVLRSEPLIQSFFQRSTSNLCICLFPVFDERFSLFLCSEFLVASSVKPMNIFLGSSRPTVNISYSYRVLSDTGSKTYSQT
jgi:hypothetical protein